MTETRDYAVGGMTCDHCARSVREKVADVEGVSAVIVDLAAGQMTVSGQGVSDDAVSAAVTEAGYQVTS